MLALLVALTSLTGAPSAPLQQAVDWEGTYFPKLGSKADSLCDSLHCLPPDALASSAPSDAPVPPFLRDAAMVLSAAGRHGAAMGILRLCRERGGPPDSLMLQEAETFFAGGEFEAGLGVNYAAEKRYPALKAELLLQRSRFFTALGMTSDAAAAEAALLQLAPVRSRFLPLSGSYSFEWSNNVYRYDPVNSRVQELADMVTRGSPVVAAQSGLDTLRSVGVGHTHYAVLQWGLRGERALLKVTPWLQVQTGSSWTEPQVKQGGANLTGIWNTGLHEFRATAGLSRSEEDSVSVSSSSSLALSWKRSLANGSFQLQASASRNAYGQQGSSLTTHYQTYGLSARLNKPLGWGLSLGTSLGSTLLWGETSRSLDSMAYVVEVSGLRDTIQDQLRVLDKTINPNLKIYDANGKTWTPGFSGSIQNPPKTLRSNLPFSEITPLSKVSTNLGASLSRRLGSRVTVDLSGNANWSVWLEKTRWTLAPLGRDSTSELLTLWHDRDNGNWYLVEPGLLASSAKGGNAQERRIYRFEVYQRRRQDLELTGGLSLSLSLGLAGDLTLQGSQSRNWSSIDDKYQDRNQWSAQAYSMEWSISF